ncbi:MAG: LLM class flavin-dependent oxidoreductase [Nitrososphaerales archaeon]
MRIKFDFCVPIFAGASAAFRGLEYEIIKMGAKEAEELGYSTVWVADHVSMGDKGEIFEGWTLLSSLSEVTKKVGIGSLVLCNAHRYPSLVAKMASTLDVISEGRLNFGIGAGWNKTEHLSYGFPWYDKPSIRVKRMEEALDIIKLLWTKERVSYHGKYYTVKDAVCEPKPLQKPHPKIWIGGGGEKLLLKTVAKYADGWNIPAIPAEVYAHKLEVLRKYCEEVGRDYNSIEKSLEMMVLITDYEDEVKKAQEWLNWLLDLQKEAGELKPRLEIKKLYIVGNLDECIKRFEEYVKVGVQRFMLYFLDLPSLKSMRRIAREIMPSFT